MPASLAVLFLAALPVAVLAGFLPGALAVAYITASVLTFLVYAWDKSAARQGQWRIRERTLHVLALAGGWPGALIAQTVLRHKSRKQAFRAISWATAFIHCAALAGLLILLPSAVRTA